ncbi:MAG: potassium transporter [Bacteroidales bacterium 36-12]|nr:MAG: potassium transporter [Bacteroidales bacterium 36-12]
MFRDFNHKLIIRIIGALLLFESFFMLTSVIVALIYKETVISSFLMSSGITFLFGVFFIFIGRNASPNIGKREGSLIVTSTWLFFTIFGLLPFVFSGCIPSVTDAFFETMSGFTTTGASIINDIESLPKSILYWRSLTHWIGGLGIIVISIALLPVFGFSSVQLFSAEATGPTKGKIHPRMSETAKRLLLIYVVLTFLEMFLLVIAGMGWFDAINHSFSTIATGGFSTKQISVGYWDSPAIQYIIIFFMFFSGINFTLFYFLIKSKFYKVFMNEELRFFSFMVLIFTGLILFSVINFSHSYTFVELEQIFRQSLFTVVSTITTTGFVVVDYTSLNHVVWIIVLILMLMGASAGSTSGGMKQIRVLLAFKYAYYEFKRLIHPNAIFPVKFNNAIVRVDVITRILSFILLYVLIIIFGAIILAFSGMGFVESLSGMISCISNVGLALGSIGPASNFSSIPEFSKWFLSFIMLVGRLEIFTVLVIFTPIFWKR